MKIVLKLYILNNFDISMIESILYQINKKGTHMSSKKTKSWESCARDEFNRILSCTSKNFAEKCDELAVMAYKLKMAHGSGVPLDVNEIRKLNATVPYDKINKHLTRYNTEKLTIEESQKEFREILYDAINSIMDKKELKDRIKKEVVRIVQNDLKFVIKKEIDSNEISTNL